MINPAKISQLALCIQIGLDETGRTNTALAIKRQVIHWRLVGFEVLYSSLMVSHLSGQGEMPRDRDYRPTIDLIG